MGILPETDFFLSAGQLLFLLSLIEPENRTGCSRKQKIMERFNISIVSYLNSRPFLYGLNRSPYRDGMNIAADIPSKVAAKLVHRQVDVGLIPVGALPDLPAYHLAGDFCIASDGAVRTVVLASASPLSEIKTVLMDYQSRTSVLLARVLARFYWKRDFHWKNTCAGFEKEAIFGETAGVVIGDRVFTIENRLPYIYDLADEWKKFTGLPFVFAVWASPYPLSPVFTEQFNQALSLGVDSLPEVEKMEAPNYPGVDIFDYFTRNIQLRLDDRKKEGMKLFLELASKLEPIPSK